MALALLLVLALLGSACQGASPDPGAGAPSPASPTSASPTPDPDEPRRGGSLKFGLRWEPEAIVPGEVAESEELAVADALFDSLTAVGEDLEVQPAAAERWTVEEGGAVFTFHLREGARFHDGAPVTAGDFVRSWNRILSQDRDLAYRLSPVAGFDAGAPLEGVEAVDPLTLRVRLAQPFYDFPALVSHPGLGPLPEGSDDAEFADMPVGNGPFQMAEPWQHDQFIRVVRFDQHHDPAWLDEVVFRVFSGTGADASAYREFRDGRLHLSPVPPEDLDVAASRHGRSPDGYHGPGVLDGESLILYYYGFNVQIPPFDDPEVRRALSLLVNRQAITGEVMRGTRAPATSLVAPPVPGQRPETCPYCRFAPEEARELLEGKGIEELRLVYNEHPAHRAVAQRVKSDVERTTGISLALEEVSFDELREGVQNAEFGFFRLGWVADVPIMDEFLTPLFSTRALADTNVSHFSDPAVDDLLVRARATEDPGERAALYREAERGILEQAPVAPVMFYRHSRVAAEAVRNLWYSPMKTANLEEVWLTSTG